MTALAKSDLYFSPEEYLEGEEQSHQKHEFLNGVVYSMSGGTGSHSAIAVTIVSQLHAQLRGKPCRPFNSDMRLRIFNGLDRRFYYPDAMVVCHPRMDELWQDEPVVLVEVLSPSSERTDRAEKRDAYFSIPSLRHYVVIDSRTVDVTVYHRHDGGWTAEPVAAPDGVIQLAAIECSLPLREIYESSGLTVG